MVPTLEGEFARKRRMMVGLWDIVVGEGMISPRGYPPLFAFELASHRLLRYLSPLLHLLVFAANLALLGQGSIYILTLLAQLALIAAALLARRYPLAPLRIARYYVMTTASIAAGLWDRCRHGRQRPLGEGGGHPLMPRARRPPDRRAGAGRALALPARRRDRDQARQPRSGHLPPAPRRPRRRRVRDVEAADDGAGLRPGRRRHGRHPRRPRVTAAGRFLRRTSLDEVPNLVNVLRGEMAIVGPRPTIPAQVDDYTPHQHRRHEVLPGITGWAQVQGRAGIPWEERIELDVEYVDRRSAGLDARILARTALAGRQRPGPRSRLSKLHHVLVSWIQKMMQFGGGLGLAR